MAKTPPPSSPAPCQELSLAVALKLAAIALTFAVISAESYEFLAQAGDWPLWLAAAIYHTALAIFLLLWLRWQGLPSQKRSPHGWIYYLPALGVAAMVALLGSLAPLASSTQAVQEVWTLKLALQILWIPLVEELLFRGGLTPLISLGGGGRWWPVYFSTLTFSWLHSIPSVERITAGKTGIYLGPLLLALACELLYRGSGRILPAILLHAACNSSVIAVSRWDLIAKLPWLTYFYF